MVVVMDPVPEHSAEKLQMTAHNPPIARMNRCLKHQMYRYHQGDATGWTRGCVLECEPEAVVSTTSNLTIPPPTQKAEPPALVDPLMPPEEQPLSPEPAINDQLPFFPT